jgi:hypothetical protein
VNLLKMSRIWISEERTPIRDTRRYSPEDGGNVSGFEIPVSYLSPQFHSIRHISLCLLGFKDEMGMSRVHLRISLRALRSPTICALQALVSPKKVAINIIQEIGVTE